MAEKTIKDAINEMMNSSLFRFIREQIGDEKAAKLASWVVHYIMIASTLMSARDIDLEEALVMLHGDKLAVISKALSFVSKKLIETKKSEQYDRYIW